MPVRASLIALLLAATPAFAQTPEFGPERPERSERERGSTVARVIDACQADLRSLCGDEPFEASAILQCVRRNRERVSSDCLAVLPSTAPSRQAGPVDLRSARRALRRACAADQRTYCEGKRGRDLNLCRRENADKFSSACQDALADLRSARQDQPRGGGRARRGGGSDEEF